MQDMMELGEELDRTFFAVKNRIAWHRKIMRAL